MQRIARFQVVAGLIGVLVAGSAGPAWGATKTDPPDQIVLSGRADVPRGRIVGQVVVFRGVASVEGVARGDVVVFSGRVMVSGQVSGDVVDLDGTIVLGPTAQVAGDVIGRGEVIVRTGAQVAGRVRSHVPFSLRQPAQLFGRFASWLAVSVSTLLLGLLLLWLTPRAAESVSRAARRSPWASAGWGIGLLVLLPVLCLIAAATLVALPLGLVILLALGLVLSVGYTFTAWVIGRRLLPNRGSATSFLAGLGIVRLLGIVPVLGGISWVLGAAFGLGTMTVAVWSARDARGAQGSRSARGKHRAGRAAVRSMPAGGVRTVPDAGPVERPTFEPVGPAEAPVEEPNPAESADAAPVEDTV